MNIRILFRCSVVVVALPFLVAAAASAQTPPDPNALLAAQREAMKSLARVDGVWRGRATTVLPNGEQRSITQTERIGSLLGGTIKVIEGRGYDAGGALTFNAFGVVSFDPASQKYSIRSYAQGRQGDFPFRPTEDGYTWEVPAGPGASVRYTATILDNRLREVGERIAGGAAPVRVFEMVLERVGDTRWPEDGAVLPR
jgi:hypothetical protein